MKHWKKLIDEKVREAIGDGNISHLPGAGKPLDLDIDPYTPEQMRISFKMMKDYNLAPDWINTSKRLNELESKLHKQIQIKADRYRRQLLAMKRKGAVLGELRLEEEWKEFVEKFIDRVGKYNKEVLLYNLTVPKNIPHKTILIGEKLVQNALEIQSGDD